MLVEGVGSGNSAAPLLGPLTDKELHLDDVINEQDPISVQNQQEGMVNGSLSARAAKQNSGRQATSQISELQLVTKTAFRARYWLTWAILSASATQKAEPRTGSACASF